MNKVITLTFDYEIYFKDNNVSFDEVLFNPTQRLLEIAKDTHSKFLFYIDIMCLLAFERECPDSEFIPKFIDQVKELEKQGMQIGFHFHPHWYDSRAENGSWSHSYNNWDYSQLIKNVGRDEAFKILQQAYARLSTIVANKVVIHRAGGLSISRSMKAYLDDLYRIGIHYDSSILPGRKYISPIQNYDFLNIEMGQKKKIGNINEVYISAIEKTLWGTILHIVSHILSRLSKKYPLKGTGASSQTDEYKSKVYCPKIDGVNHSFSFLLNYFTHRILKKNNKMIILAHPKSLTEKSFNLIEKYIAKNRDHFDFTT